MQVAPGKSITAQDVELALADVNSKKKSATAPLKTKRKRNRSVSSSSEDDTMMVLESDGVSETFSDLEEILNDQTANDKPSSSGISHGSSPLEGRSVQPEYYAADNFVIVI